MLLASFVLILGLAAGLVAFEYYLLVEPLQWIAQERFEVTKGWTKSVCTVLQRPTRHVPVRQLSMARPATV